MTNRYNPDAPVAPSILTQSGRYFDYLTPEHSPLSVQDIAHALAHICRFGGHTKTYYSVAQHSVLVSCLVPKDHAMAALFHDAAEAVLGDIPTPLKRLLPDYREIEHRVERAILGKFGIAYPLPPTVKHADLVLLATERRDLVCHHPEPWPILAGIEPHPRRIVPLGPHDARALFLQRYAELSAQRSGATPAKVAA